MIISGAYGRDYKSVEAIKADLLADRDFAVRDLFHGGGYTNRADLLRLGISSVQVRYKEDRSVTVLDLHKLAPKAPKGAARRVRE